MSINHEFIVSFSFLPDLDHTGRLISIKYDVVHETFYSAIFFHKFNNLSKSYVLVLVKFTVEKQFLIPLSFLFQ